MQCSNYVIRYIMGHVQRQLLYVCQPLCALFALAADQWFAWCRPLAGWQLPASFAAGPQKRPVAPLWAPLPLLPE